MSPEEALIDQYVTESGVILAQLADHLVTLDELRDSHKRAALDRFGLPTDPASCDGNVRDVISSHLERYDTDMGSYLRYAHVVLTYVVFENRLHAFGQLISVTHRGAPFFPRKVKGSNLLYKFERYLHALSLAAPPKAAVEALRLIRNCVVHCRGCVADYSGREKLKEYLQNLVGVTIDSQNRLTLTTEGCLRLQEGVIEYLQEVDSVASFYLSKPADVRKNFEKHILPHLIRPIRPRPDSGRDRVSTWHGRQPR